MGRRSYRELLPRKPFENALLSIPNRRDFETQIPFTIINNRTSISGYIQTFFREFKVQVAGL